MAYSVNWDTRVINIPKSDLADLGGGVYKLDLELCHQELRRLEWDFFQGFSRTLILEYVPPLLAGGVIYARFVLLSNGYTITFEDGQYAVNFDGANTNIQDYTNVNQVSIRPNNSAGLQDLSTLLASAYQGRVVIDVINGQSGTAVPVGTLGKPVNNIPDAVEIASVLGLGEIHVIGNIVLDSGDDVNGFRLVGQNPTRTYITILPAAATLSCELREATVIGTLDGNATLRDCVLGPVDYVNGSVIHSGMTNSPVLLGGNASAIFAQTFSLVPGYDTPTIDLGGSGQSLGVRGHIGGLKIINKTGEDPCSIDMVSGHLIVDETCATGDIYTRGTFYLTDNSGPGCTVHIEGKVQTGETINSVIVSIDDSIAQQMVTAISEVGYTNDIANNQIVQLNREGNEIARFDCFSESGQPTLSNIKTMVLA